MALSIVGTGYALSGGGGGGGSTDALTVSSSGIAGEAITSGDLLRFDRSGTGTAGQLRRARAIGLTESDVAGVAKTSAAGAGSPLTYYLLGEVPVTLDTPPPTTANGERIYLSPSDPGWGTLTVPTDKGEAITFIGFLSGADGTTSNPTCVFNPALIALL